MKNIGPIEFIEKYCVMNGLPIKLTQQQKDLINKEPRLVWTRKYGYQIMYIEDLKK